jgi:predicted nuclease of predicted toxin-antitoxin system
MIFREIKVLTDENISPKVVVFLRNSGMDVLDTKEQSWYGMEDIELLKIAFQQDRFVLTHDSDFGTLSIHEGNRFYGIVYFRLKYPHPNNVITACKHLLEQKTEFSPRTIVVVEDTRLRIRKL